MGADGAVLVDQAGALHGTAPVSQVINTVGAGDALLAGYLQIRYADPAAREDALANALRWGAVAVQHAGTTFPGMIAAQHPDLGLGRPGRGGPTSSATPADRPPGLSWRITSRLLFGAASAFQAILGIVSGSTSHRQGFRVGFTHHC